MSAPYVVSLAVAVGLVFGSRFVVPVLPSRRHARPITVVDAVLTAVGLAGLTFHCSAMFFSSLVAALPGTSSAIDQINALGTPSKIGYVLPALLVVIGLRRQHPLAVAAVGIALAAVGITMYDGGSLSAHLAAIFVAIVVIAGVVSTLVLPPWGSVDRSVGTVRPSGGW